MNKPGATPHPHRRLYQILKIAVCILLAAAILCAVDSFMVRAGNKPIFCIPIYYQDGGTVSYYGLGYQFIYWNSLKTYDQGKTHGHLVGIETNYLFGIRSVGQGPGVELEYIPDETP